MAIIGHARTDGRSPERKGIIIASPRFNTRHLEWLTIEFNVSDLADDSDSDTYRTRARSNVDAWRTEAFKRGMIPVENHELRVEVFRGSHGSMPGENLKIMKIYGKVWAPSHAG